MQRDIHLPRFWIKPYYKSFNGLRGLAVLMVFIHHYCGSVCPWLVNWTWEGVDLFFVLSGFLITGILYDSLQDRHFFRSFYVRRALRIFPIFYGFFLLLLLLTPILHLRYHLSILFFVFYVGNLAVPFLNLATNNPTIIYIFHHGHLHLATNIGHLWSLCVEEQFYLMWPAVVWFVRDRKRLMQLCVVLITATVLGRIYLWSHASPVQVDQYLIFWGTYTRCDTILTGAWLALWLRGNALSIAKVRGISFSLLCGSVIATIIGATHSTAIWLGIPVHFIDTIGFTFMALASAGLILWCLDEESYIARLSQWRPLSELGIISYGFYFYHLLPCYFWDRLQRFHPALRYAVPFLAFGFAVGLATLSFRYFESPFLRLKTLFAPQEKSEGEASRLHVSVPQVQEPTPHSSLLRP